MSFIISLLIGVFAGFIAHKILNKNKKSLWIYLIVGTVGSVIGGWIFGFFGFQSTESTFNRIVTASVGAVVLIYGLDWFQKRK